MGYIYLIIILAILWAALMYWIVYRSNQDRYKSDTERWMTLGLRSNPANAKAFRLVLWAIVIIAVTLSTIWTLMSTNASKYYITLIFIGLALSITIVGIATLEEIKSVPIIWVSLAIFIFFSTLSIFISQTAMIKGMHSSTLSLSTLLIAGVMILIILLSVWAIWKLSLPEVRTVETEMAKLNRRVITQSGDDS